MSEGEHYQPETGLHTIDRLKGHVRMHLQDTHLKPAEWQRVILMEILLHMYDKLDSIERAVWAKVSE